METTHHKGRGAVSNPDSRFTDRITEHDEHEASLRSDKTPETQLKATPVGRIISSNSSPDIPFDLSVNPYQGCEHGCVYCYARPSHSYLDLSPGLDFETKIFYKPDAANKLVDEWQKPGYECKPITIGANTDPYQPADKSLQLTRQLLRQFCEFRHPVNIITKSHLITRDLDLLEELAADRLCSVAISIPTMDADLKRIMEPRVPAASARLNAIRELRQSGVPVSLLLAPVIPAINDGEIESILESAAEAGVTSAHYIMLRLPHELKEMFSDWLHLHFPERAEHVMSLLRQANNGKEYDHRFGQRQTGSGPFAEMLGKRFRNACKKLDLGQGHYQQGLDCSRFLHPAKRQMGFGF